MLVLQKKKDYGFIQIPANTLCVVGIPIIDKKDYLLFSTESVNKDFFIIERHSFMCNSDDACFI